MYVGDVTEPSGATLAPPPKLFAVEAAKLPSAFCVEYN